MTTANRQYPDLDGKTAVVTGGSSPIGAAICRQLASNGARVVVSGRNAKIIDEVVQAIRWDGGEAEGVVADCTERAPLERLREIAERVFGPADILATIAGGYGAPTPFEEIDEQEWRFVVDANLTSTFLTIQCFLPAMILRRHGAILTMASSAGRLPGGASAPYAAAKAGVVMLSRHLAREMGPHGVRVNCLSPSAVDAGWQGSLPEEQRRQMLAQFPLGRIGVPDDVAQAAAFLLSDAASWITGVTLDIAGGRIMV
jgi:3-oxoacyl-[acyl-carrier protein] reductase